MVNGKNKNAVLSHSKSLQARYPAEIVEFHSEMPQETGPAPRPFRHNSYMYQKY